MKAKRSIVWLLSIAMLACTVDQVLTDLNLLVTISGAIIPALGNVSPEDAAIAQKMSTIASDGIAAVQAAYKDYKASGGTTGLAEVQAAVTAVKDNLAQELAAAHISNPAVVQKVTAWVNLISTTLNAVLSALPQPGVVGAQVGSVPAPAHIKARWQMEVCGGDAKCAALVK